MNSVALDRRTGIVLVVTVGALTGRGSRIRPLRRQGEPALLVSATSASYAVSCWFLLAFLGEGELAHNGSSAALDLVIGEGRIWSTFCGLPSRAAFLAFARVKKAWR